ncbi:DUF4397 domain-containing protein [Sediminibacterium soli]|uniref:DUF4397 domain-containing protein n=1 Tax=Sediminibacterium soli TaxID=2698829 RepID=UPI001379B710|nr:DUF4397 domain-containing protein [Sediminibacterium soli]NCI46075.1 DUF4397 domain-containing protein [Sediminibacterium soli]
MKKITFYISLFAAGVMAITACKKEAKVLATYDDSENNAFLRIVHASPNFRQVFNLPDSFNVYVNGGKVNSPYLTYGTAAGTIFPASTTSFGYMAVKPGLVQLKLSVNGFASNNPDSTLLLNLSKVMIAGGTYTLMITDSIQSTRDSSQIFLPDAYAKPVGTNVGLRFVHAVWNDTATKTVDIFSYARNATIFSNIKPGGATSFSNFGYNATVDTLYVTRPAAAGTPISGRIVLAKMAFSPTVQRVYTLYYRGDGNLTTGTKARTLLTYVHN